MCVFVFFHEGTSLFFHPFVCFVCFDLNWIIRLYRVPAGVFLRASSLALRQDAELDTCTITADGLKEPLKFLGPVEFFADFWPIILWAAASNKEVRRARQ